MQKCLEFFLMPDIKVCGVYTLHTRQTILISLFNCPKLMNLPQKSEDRVILIKP